MSTDSAIDALFDRVDDMLLEGRFQDVNQEMVALNVSELDTDTIITWLSITLAAHDKLPARDALVMRCEKRLQGPTHLNSIEGFPPCAVCHENPGSCPNDVCQKCDIIGVSRICSSEHDWMPIRLPPELPELKFVETLLFYNGPMIWVGRSAQMMFVTFFQDDGWVDDVWWDEWLLVPATRVQVIALKANRLTLRDLIVNAPTALLMRDSVDESLRSSRWIDPSTLPDDSLPVSGVYLGVT